MNHFAQAFNLTGVYQSHQRASRSTSRKNSFVADISTEDTPLSLRKNADSKRKRFTLYTKNDHSEEVEAHHNSAEDNLDEESASDMRQCYAGECETEKLDLEQNDGVRRSQRPKKILHGSYNDSWIFAEKSVRVKTIDCSCVTIIL